MIQLMNEDIITFSGTYSPWCPLARGHYGKFVPLQEDAIENISTYKQVSSHLQHSVPDKNEIPGILKIVPLLTYGTPMEGHKSIWRETAVKR